MSKKLTFTLAFAIAFVFVANLRADVVDVYTSEAAFKDLVSPSDWGFTGDPIQTGGNGYTKWTFATENGTTGVNGEGTIYATTPGSNGNGKKDGQANTIGLQLESDHNRADIVTVSFLGDQYIDSFWVFFERPWSSVSATSTLSFWATYDTLTDVGLKTEVFAYDPFEAFFGITLDEGAILKTINWDLKGSNGDYGNNGYYVTMGFGGEYEPSNQTPEPATLAIIGLGLAGLGAARARRRK